MEWGGMVLKRDVGRRRLEGQRKGAPPAQHLEGLASRWAEGEGKCKTWNRKWAGLLVVEKTGNETWCEATMKCPGREEAEGGAGWTHNGAPPQMEREGGPGGGQEIRKHLPNRFQRRWEWAFIIWGLRCAAACGQACMHARRQASQSCLARLIRSRQPLK